MGLFTIRAGQHIKMTDIGVHHPVVLEQVKSLLSGHGDLRGLDMKICDYDGINYLLHGLSTDVLGFSAIVPQLASVGRAGGFESLTSAYGSLSGQVEGNTYTLTVERSRLVQGDALQIASALSKFRVILLAAPFARSLEAVQGAATWTAQEVRLRPNEGLWVLPGEDRATFVFQVHYEDLTDSNLARVFLQEFTEAKRQIPNAPVVSFSSAPPEYISAFPSSKQRVSVGYLSITILREQISEVQAQAEWLCSFRQFLNYHIHACKIYLHVRMRKRTNHLLGALKLAVPGELDDKVFRQARATKTFKEESKVLRPH